MQDVLDNPGVAPVDQPLLSAVGMVYEPGMIEPKKVENCCLEIVGSDHIFNSAVTHFVGGSVGHAPLDSASRQPGREPLAVMIAAGRRVGVALGDGKAADLAPPVHERRVE